MTVVMVTLKKKHIPDGCAVFSKCNVQDLFHHWLKFIAFGGDYVVKLSFVADNLLCRSVL